jgi:membrane AbrB-like protein
MKLAHRLELAFRQSRRVVLTLLAAWIAAQACVALHTPLPWMIGPLLITSALSIAGVRTLSWNPFRNTGQWVIGVALGLSFTPHVNAMVVSLWWLVVVCIVWSLALGYGFGLWLYAFNAPRFVGLDKTTTYFASLIGGASEITLIAERKHARTDLVAAAHSLRVLIVTVAVPSAIQGLGWHGLDVAPSNTQAFSASGLLLLTLLTGLGAMGVKMMGRSNPWFIGSLLVSIGLASNEIALSSIPVEMTNAAQLAIGVSLGVRFTADFLHTAPRWLASVGVGTLVMILLCVGFSFVLQELTQLPLATMVLSTAPGGIAEMAITAKVLQLGVAVVTALQVCRLIAVLILAEPLFIWLHAKGFMNTKRMRQ